MDPIKYIVSTLLGFSLLVSFIYGIESGYYKEKNMEMYFSIKDSGLMNVVIFVTLGFFLFEVLCSSVNEELFNNMQIKIQKISEAKLVLDNLEE
jgi:hypothetical protein